MTVSHPIPILERDPVCGMSVNPATAKHVHEHGGKKYYFCWASALEKFKADPQIWLNPPRPGDAGHTWRRTLHVRSHPSPPKSAAATSLSTAYVCPMCPEVREPKPGACPSCGMALEPEVPRASTRTEYTCPMHPEIVRPGPGRARSVAWRSNRAPSPPHRRESRTARHDPPLLDRRRLDRAACWPSRWAA